MDDALGSWNAIVEEDVGAGVDLAFEEQAVLRGLVRGLDIDKCLRTAFPFCVYSLTQRPQITCQTIKRRVAGQRTDSWQCCETRLTPKELPLSLKTQLLLHFSDDSTSNLACGHCDPLGDGRCWPTCEFLGVANRLPVPRQYKSALPRCDSAQVNPTINPLPLFFVK